MSRRYAAFFVLALALAHPFSGRSIGGPSAVRAQAMAQAGAEALQQHTPTPTPLPCLDQYEPDDTPAEAKTIPDQAEQWRSICPAGDVDYVRFVARQALYYSVGAWVVQDEVTTRVQLYAPDGTTELARGEGRRPGVDWWHCTSDGPHFAKVSVVDPLPGAPRRTYRLQIVVVGHDTPTAPPRTPKPPRYVPLGLSRWRLDALSPVGTAQPSLTPNTTSTPTSTPGPTATPTAVATLDGSLFKVGGYVREGSESGPGLPGVAVNVSIQTYSLGAFVTDADGYYESGVHRFHRESFYVRASKGGYHFVPDGVGGTHYGYGEEEFHRVDFVALRGEPTYTPAEYADADFVNAISIDPASGDKWFGTRLGVSRLRQDETLERYTTANGLAQDSVNAIAIDAATGDTWFGTNHGVSRLGVDGSWRTFSTPADGLAGDWVGAIAIDAATGDKWFGNAAGASRLRADGTWRFYTTADGLARGIVRALAIDAISGDVWFGVEGGGVSRLRSDGTWRTFTTADGLARRYVFALAIDGVSGDVWIGTDRGVSRLGSDGGWRTFTAADGLASDRVGSIAIDAATGDRWFGTGAGVSRLGADGAWRTFTTADGLAHAFVRAVVIDPTTGDKWFGTGGGVSRHGRDGQWRTYSLRPR